MLKANGLIKERKLRLLTKMQLCVTVKHNSKTKKSIMLSNTLTQIECYYRSQIKYSIKHFPKRDIAVCVKILDYYSESNNEECYTK